VALAPGRRARAGALGGAQAGVRPTPCARSRGASSSPVRQRRNRPIPRGPSPRCARSRATECFELAQWMNGIASGAARAGARPSHGTAAARSAADP
jgi:hypothetical protein